MPFCCPYHRTIVDHILLRHVAIVFEDAVRKQLAFLVIGLNFIITHFNSSPVPLAWALTVPCLEASGIASRSSNDSSMRCYSLQQRDPDNGYGLLFRDTKEGLKAPQTELPL